MYLDFARKDLERGKALSARFGKELERWGKARIDHIDRLNAIQLIPHVEAQGFVGEERFAEVARRIERFRGKDPDERLIRKWWETRKRLGAAALVADEILSRGAGRPRTRK
jgi:hypothetical protein